MRIALIVLAIILLARLSFLLVNYSHFAGSETEDIVGAFARGVRFDLATTLLTITAPILLLWLPAPKRIRQVLLQISLWLMAIILVVAEIVLAGDIFFFGESSRHVALEPLDMLSDVKPIAKTLVDGYLLAALAAIALLAASIWLIARIYRTNARDDSERRGWDVKRIYLLIPFLLITLIGIRGGFQKEPLKSADAVIGKSAILGNIVLNGWYNFLTESIKSKRPDHFMDDQQAVEEIRSLVDRDAEYLSDQFPLLRKSFPSMAITAEGEKLNVVLIIVESLAADYLQAFGGKTSVMPFLDSLANQSLIFTNFQSISTRSFRGVTAILASYPVLSVDSYRLTSLLPNLRGLGEILSENRYSVRFMHAAPKNSMGITAVTGMAGYGDFVSEEDFSGGQSNGSWGVWDHIALERMTVEMDQMTEPFHYGIFTLCTHSPWTLPDGFDAPFKPVDETSEIYNTFAYLDSALQDFFERESKRERYAKTLYIIVGDHTTHMDEIQRFRVGSIFYAPGRLTPLKDNRLSGQLDILPTILDLCGIETPHTSFGKSLVQLTDNVEWSIHCQSNQLNFRQGGNILVSTIVHNVGLYRSEAADYTGRGLLYEEKDLADVMTFRLKAIYQIAEMAMKQNRIAPEEGNL